MHERAGRSRDATRSHIGRSAWASRLRTVVGRPAARAAGRQGQRLSGRGWSWAARVPACQDLFGGGFVLLNDARGDAPAVADRDARLFRPRRIPPLRSRLNAVRPGRRRGPRPALRACAMKSASWLQNAVAFFLLRSISYSAPPRPNRTVSSAGPVPAPARGRAGRLRTSSLAVGLPDWGNGRADDAGCGAGRRGQSDAAETAGSRAG